MSELFESNEDPRFDDLVGEGKKFKDSDALAKKAYHADQHISRLEAELQELRTDLSARTTLEDMLGKIQKPQERAPESTRETPPTQRREPESSSVDIAAEVQKLLKAEKEKDSREGNINKTREGLKERFGGDYNQKLESISSDLGVSKEFLTEMAAKSPAGFFKLVDSVSQPDANRQGLPPRSAHVPETSGSSKKNSAYYSELRRSDPNTYFSKRVQNEMHQEAMKQGAAFYGR